MTLLAHRGFKSRYRIRTEEDEINRAILADMLGKEYEVIEAANGMQALETIRKRNMEIDLMLLDIIMPELDGFKVLEAMNQWR